MQEFENQSALVVGGAGFVGSNTVKALLSSNAKRVVIVDNLLSAEEENIPKDSRVEFIHGSITKENVLNQVKDEHDYIFHLSTYHGNQSSMHDPLADHENNTYTTLRLYEHIKDFKQLKKVVYSSAGCTVAKKTYDEPMATDEDAPVSLYHDSPYQMSKIFGEFYSNYYFKQKGLPVVKARFQNVYGPGEVLGAGEWRGTPATVWRNVTPTFIYRALKHMPLIVENEGKSTRDFIYVEDIVNGLLCCAARGAAGEVFNLASGVETSILELAQQINELAQNPTPIEIGPKRPWDHSGRRYGSTQKAKEQIGFEVKMGLADGLRKTIDWTKASIDFIDACVQKHAAHLEK